MYIHLICDLEKIKVTSFDYNILTSITKDKILLQDASVSTECPERFGQNVVITDTDAGILRWKSQNVPVIAWSHANNASESLMGTPWLILSADALDEDYIREVYCHFHGIPLTILETSRCRLRELSRKDLPELEKLDEEQPAISSGRFFRDGESDPETFLRKYIEVQYSFYGFGFYGAFDRITDEFLGIAGFYLPEKESGGNPDEQNRPDEQSDIQAEDLEYLEIGYAVRKSARRKGYAGEWVSALLRYARENFPHYKITARISSDNTASIRVAKHCNIPIISQYPLSYRQR